MSFRSAWVGRLPAETPSPFAVGRRRRADVVDRERHGPARRDGERDAHAAVGIHDRARLVAERRPERPGARLAVPAAGAARPPGSCTCSEDSKPVPAGMSRPIVTFSFSPRRLVDLPGDRRLGQHARRFLEARRRDERVGRERRLRDPEQQRLRRRWTPASPDHPLVLFQEPELVHLLVGKGVAEARPSPTASSAAR